MTTSIDALDMFVIKLDAQGDFVWMNIIGGMQNERGIDLHVNNEQSLIVLANEYPKASVYKFSSTGSFEYYYSSDYSSSVSPRSVASDSDGNVYVIGSFSDTVDFDNSPTEGDTLFAQGNEDGFLLKLDSNGEYVWSKKFGGSGSGVTPEKIVITNDEQLITTGLFYGSIDFDPGIPNEFKTASGSTDIFTAKFDSSGNFNWVIQTGGINSNQVEDLKLDEFGNIYSVGHYEGSMDADPSETLDYILNSNGDTDIYIQKLDADGNFIWAQSIGSSSYDIANALCIDPSGELYVSGHFTDVVDFDVSANNAQLVSDITADGYVLKITEDGDFNWVIPFEGIDAVNSGIAIDLDNQNNIILGGRYAGTVDLDPSTNEELITSLGSIDGFVLKLNQNSAFLAEKAESEIRVFPNPTSGAVQLPNEIISFKLYTLSGKLVLESKVKNGNIDLSYIQRGTYMLVVETDQHYFKNTKIVVE